MKRYINLLSNTDFFKGIPAEELSYFLSSHICYLKDYEPGVTIYCNGALINYAGIILDGNIDIIHSSSSGNDTIVNRLSRGDMFGESFACVGIKNALSEIRSVTFCSILFINIHKLISDNSCLENIRMPLIRNIMKSLAQSNISLNTKIQLLTQKTLREKLLAYLHMLSVQNQSLEFDLPFNREQLACYLASERSSVCRELGKLQRENIIRLNRNHIIILQNL